MSGLRVLLNMSNCKRSYWVISIAKSIFNLQHYHGIPWKRRRRRDEKFWYLKKSERGNTDEKHQHLSDACHRQTHIKLPPAILMFWGKIVGKTYIGKWTLSLLSITIIQYQYQTNLYLSIYWNIYSIYSILN